MKRTLILLLLWAVPCLGDWSTQPWPTFTENDDAVRYGVDLSKIDLSVKQDLLPDRVYGEHDGIEGPYRKWISVGHVHYKLDPAKPTYSHRSHFFTYDADDTLKVWMQRGSEVPVLSVIAQSRPSGLDTFAVTLVMRALPCPTMRTTTGPNFIELADATTLPQYGDDLSGLDLAYAHNAIVPQYVGDEGRVWYRPGRILYDDGDPANAFSRSHRTEFYTDQEEIISIWLQRGAETPVLAMVTQSMPGQWVGAEGEEEWWPYFKVEVTTDTHLSGGVINPGGAAFSHGDGDLTYSDTGFTVGGLTHQGLPPESTASLTTVEITNLVLAQGYATLKVYYTDEDVELYNLDEPALRLYWYDDVGESWILAGNKSNLMDNSGDPAYTGFISGVPSDVLGDWGVETGGNYVWANIDHASLYVASEIPEPSTVCLLALGALGFAVKKRNPVSTS